MRNLRFLDPETKKKVEAVLADPAVHFFAKDMIEAGLEKDPVDAYLAAKHAHEILRMVADVHLDHVRKLAEALTYEETKGVAK